MDVTLKKSSELERVLTVSLTDGELKQETASRLKKKSKTANLSGFRKGHAPAHVIERYYGDAIHQEAVEQLINDSLTGALNERKLRPATTPRVDNVRVDNGALHYTALFEILPDIKLVPAEKLTIEKPECEISEADIDAGLEQLRRHYREMRPVTRAAAIGDAVEYELTATMPDGKTIGPRKEQIELRDQQTPKKLADTLIGAGIGDERQMDMPVEAPPSDQDTKGKPVTASCRLKILNVLEIVLPELNEEFMNRLQLQDGMPQLRAEVRRNLKQESDHRLRDRQWSSICAGLTKAHAGFALPKAMVEQERTSLQKRGMDEKAATAGAEHKVREQLVIAEIVRQHNISVSSTAVRRLVENAAAGYKDSSAFITWHYAEEERLNSFRMLALRNQVMDWLLERAQLKPVTISFPALASGAS